MASFARIGIGIGASVVAIGVWVAVKTFTGKKVGEECHAGSDTDCRGWSAQCLTSKAGSYCSKECKAERDCPSGWACDTIGITEIDAKGNISKRESSMKMCQRGVPGAEGAAAASASAASSAPAPSAAPPVASSAPTPTPDAPPATHSASTRGAPHAAPTKGKPSKPKAK